MLNNWQNGIYEATPDGTVIGGVPYNLLGGVRVAAQEVARHRLPYVLFDWSAKRPSTRSSSKTASRWLSGRSAPVVTMLVCDEFRIFSALSLNRSSRSAARCSLPSLVERT